MRKRAGAGSPGQWLGLAVAVSASALGCFGCGAPPESGLRVESVEPQQIVYNTWPVTIRAFGSFMPHLELTLAGAAGPTLDERFTAMVGEVPASTVRFKGRDELEITLATYGMSAKSYPLVVTDPRGKTATLLAAVTVVNGQPTRVVFTSSKPTPGMGEPTGPLRVDFRDERGNPASLKSDTRVTFTSDSPTGRFWYGAKGPEQRLDAVLDSPRDGFDFSFMDTRPGTPTLTITVDGLPPITEAVVVGDNGPFTESRAFDVPKSPARAGEAPGQP